MLGLPYPLLPWQRVALGEWRRAKRRGVVEVVTGGGKTYFAEACIHDATIADPELRVLVIVPSVPLLDQWLVGLQDDLSIADSEIGKFGGGYSSSEPKRFNIAVLNSARKITNVITSTGRWMLVVDECHRAGTPVNQAALDGRFVAVLGLSATPNRPYDDNFTAIVKPVVGNVVYSYGLVDARKDGVVSAFKLVNVQFPLLRHEQKQYSKLSQRIGRLASRSEHDTGDLAERLESLYRARARIANRAALRVPVTIKLLNRVRGKRTIVFHEDIGRANAICDIARSHGHSVIPYHTRIPPKTRASNLRLFRRGVNDVIIACRALDEGINVPDVEVAIVSAGSATARQRIQRLGRVLRKAKAKELAIVYTLFATQPERTRLLSESAELDDVAEVQWMKVNVAE